MYICRYLFCKHETHIFYCLYLITFSSILQLSKMGRKETAIDDSRIEQYK